MVGHRNRRHLGQAVWARHFVRGTSSEGSNGGDLQDNANNPQRIQWSIKRQANYNDWSTTTTGHRARVQLPEA